jgi:hypothetical protein
VAYAFAGRKRDVVLNINGDPQPNRSYQLFVWGTSTPAVRYTNRLKQATSSTPLATDNRGYFDFFVDPGEYGIVVQGESQQQYIRVDEDPAETVNYSDLGVSVATLIDGKVPAEQLPNVNDDLDPGTILALLDAWAIPSKVTYSGSSYPARPNRPAGLVIYDGPVQPTSWQTGDLWVEAG